MWFPLSLNQLRAGGFARSERIRAAWILNPVDPENINLPQSAYHSESWVLLFSPVVPSAALFFGGAALYGVGNADIFSTEGLVFLPKCALVSFSLGFAFTSFQAEIRDSIANERASDGTISEYFQEAIKLLKEKAAEAGP